MILCKVIRDTLQSNTYYLGKYHVLLFPDFQGILPLLLYVQKSFSVQL